MRFNLIIVFSFLVLTMVGCKTAEMANYKSNRVLKNNYINGNSIAMYEGISDTTFVKLTDFGSDFVLDMKYATNDNFMKQKVYDCADCYLRLKTIKYLKAANAEFMQKGYRIKLFDCYRPLDIQKKMWQLVPNADYVADPNKGSVHNRGGALDLTLVDETGRELDMGTPFDFFGPEASHNYQGFPRRIIKNRAYLKEVMLKHNFKAFSTEWWHYNLTESTKDKLSNFKWNCN